MSDSANSPSDAHGDHPGSPGVLSGDTILIDGLGDGVLLGGHELRTFLHSVSQNIISDFQKDDFDLGGHMINLHDLTSYNPGSAIGSVPGFNQPTQVPIGTPISLQFISSALLFLPEILGVIPR
jgi:hypothetical protein